MYSGKQEPWYAPNSKKKAAGLSGFSEKHIRKTLQGRKKAEKYSLSWKVILSFLACQFSLLLGGFLLGHAYFASSELAWISIGGFLLLLGSSIFFVLVGVAQVARFLMIKARTQEGMFETAFAVIRGELKIDEPRKGVPAPELALNQFVMQVRAYASEKSFQKLKTAEQSYQPISGMETVDILKRRWNEVQDSLNEFEVYLANDPKGMIEKLVTKQPLQLIDVSQIFREVAENFDTAWRKKGINIEAAVVTPLRATTHEPLLRRLLVGPWRFCAYFARRGNSVLFSAKSEEGKVVARWECEGLSIPPEYLEYVQDDAIPVNERIEKGLTILSQDPNNAPNILHALVSFVVWVDLANCVQIAYEFKNNNNGFVVEIKLS